MEIKVLGTGCPKCVTLEKNVQQAVAELGLDATISKVTELSAIMEYDVMLTPALVVDGKVVLSGRVPDSTEIGRILSDQ